MGHNQRKLLKGAGGGPFSVEFTDHITVAAEQSGGTYSGKSIGVADSSRRIYAALATTEITSGTTTITISLDGTPMTQVGYYQIDNGAIYNSSYSILFALDVPTGTTAEFITDYSGPMSFTEVGIFAAYNSDPTLKATYSNGSANNGDPHPVTVSGVVVAAEEYYLSIGACSADSGPEKRGGSVALDFVEGGSTFNVGATWGAGGISWNNATEVSSTLRTVSSTYSQFGVLVAVIGR